MRTAKVLACVGILFLILQGVYLFFARGVWIFWILGGLYFEAIILILSGGVILYALIRPDNPIPFNWKLLGIVGIIVIVFGSLIAGGIIIIAGIFAYFAKDTSE